MDYNEYRSLIERYWISETTIQEEKRLINLYHRHPYLPADLEKWRSWFLGLEGLTDLPDKDFDEKIIKIIDEKAAVVRKKLFYRMAIAASVALIFMIGVKKGLPKDRYTNEVTEAEMTKAVETLLMFTSSEMNRAETTAKEQLKTTQIITGIINNTYDE